MADISSVTLTKVSTLSIGNKKGKIWTAHVGDGSATFPVAGVSLTAANLGLKKVEFVSIDGATLHYTYDYTNSVLQAYTASSAAAAAVVFVQAASAVPHEDIRIVAIGY